MAVVTDEAMILGAFQRAAGLPSSPCTLDRRGSGGPEVRVGSGTVYVGLALAQPGALIPCDERRIVNRYVRPLLRGLTRAGHLAHHFGRDWVSVAHRPVAWVGFGHDAGTRRTLVEAFVAVRTPFAWTERASFLGKAHGTLESIGGRPVDAAALAERIVEAYARDVPSDGLPWPEPATRQTLPDPLDPPWAATTDEAIGALGAGPDAAGAFRIGGDLLVSRDALARLESRLATTEDADVARVIDETLAAPGVALDGVRSLASVRDVVLRARQG